MAAGLVAPLGPAEPLEAFDEVPPEAIQVLVGVLVHGGLEADHDLGPGGEDRLQDFKAEGDDFWAKLLALSFWDLTRFLQFLRMNVR